MYKMLRKNMALTVVASLWTTTALAQQVQDMLPTKDDVATKFETDHFSPYAGRNFPTQVLWGDTHLHTEVSVDAGTMTTMSQEDAYRFARGEEVTTTHGLKAKLNRPLDFLVISDHSEMYGLMPQLLGGDQEILATEQGQAWYGELTSNDADRIFATAVEIVASLSGDVPPIDNPKATKKAWEEYTALADRYNDPGVFTALIGYEWTAAGGDNIHRNVIFRGDADEANEDVPSRSSTARTPKTCGLIWRPARTKLAARSSPYRTTATCRMRGCSMSRTSTAHRSALNWPNCGPVSNRSSRRPRSKATARRIRSLARMMSLRISTHGTHQI